jgi:hypothetical protein
MAFRGNGGYVHFVGFWLPASGFWLLAPGHGQGPGPGPGQGPGQGQGPGSGPAARLWRGGGTEAQSGRNSFFGKTTDILKNCFPSKTFSGEIVYPLGGSLRHGPGRGDEARSKVEGRRSKAVRPAPAGTQWAGDSVSPIRSEREGSDPTRIGRGIKTRGAGQPFYHTGGSESKVNRSWAPSPGGPSLPRRRGSMGIHYCDLTSGRPLLHLTQPNPPVASSACCEGWTWRDGGRD